MKNKKKVFILGIKGVAMTGLAVIYKKMGYEVFGSDVPGSFITDKIINKYHIKYDTDFKLNTITKDLSFVVYSAAHNGEKNPLIQKAKNFKIKIYNQAELIGKLLKNFNNTVAVAGSHGKTTTSSLLSYALINLGVKPSYLTGSSGFNNYMGADYQDNKYFIFEADEYAVNPPYNKKIKLRYYKPDDIIITNIDFDHPDVYKNIKSIEIEFKDFINKPKDLFYCADDPFFNKYIIKNKAVRLHSFGFSNKSDLKIISYETNINGTVFKLSYKGKDLGLFATKLFGEKNVLNTAGVILFLINKGFNLDKIKNSIKNFIGAKRRFEKIFELNKTFLFDDYAHHPKEIQSSINTARSVFKNKRIIVIFHPHTYSRTKYFVSDFADSLSLADYSLVLPIFASARENSKNFNISSEDIVQKNLKNKNIIAFKTKEKLLEKLKNIIKKEDIIFTMGAGDVYLLNKDIIKIIKTIV